MKLKWTQGNGCKLFAVLLTGLVTVAAAAAPAKAPDPPKKPPRVRTGYIAKAEFTTEKPSSEGESRIGGKSSPAWAIITLDLDPGRAVSVFDYVLTKDGTEYPCLDMAENDDAFTGTLRNYSSMNPRKCRLAFAVPSADDEYGIVFKLADDSNPVKLNVKPPQEPDPAHESQNVSQSRTSQGSNSSDAFKRGEEYAKQGNYAEAVKCYLEAAEQGDAKAQCALARWYHKGIGVKKDELESVKWYHKGLERLRKAAEQGDAEAQFILALCYAEGGGVEKDLTEAFKWYRKAAEQGHLTAQRNVAYYYMHGKGVRENQTEAVKWYRKAAEQGDAGACVSLGECYEHGKGVRENQTEAFKWYRKAVERRGSWTEINPLARCYAYGKGVKKDITKAAAWWKKMREDYYCLRGQDAFYMGQCYFYGRGVAENKEEAMKWYANAVTDDLMVNDQFDNVNDAVEAGYMYGVCYSLGYRMGIQDLFGFKKTEDCQGYVIMGLEFAANRGHRKSQELLDDLKRKGKL